MVPPSTTPIHYTIIGIHSTYTGDEDIIVGSSSDSRNPLVLRIPVTSSDTFERLIQRVQVELEASADEVPFSLLLSNPNPNLSLTLEDYTTCCLL